MINTLTVAAAVSLLCCIVSISLRGPRLLEFDRESTVPLRGIMALLVIIGHLWGASGRTSEWLATFKCGGSAVAVFFFMSGYGYEKMMSVKGAGYLNGLFPRTLKKLVVPLLLATVAYCLVTYFYVGNFRPLKLLLGYVHGGTGFLPHSWYVYKLLFFALGFSLIRRRFGQSGIWLFTAVTVTAFQFVLKWRGWWFGSDWSFPVGMTFAAFEPKIRALISRRPLLTYFTLLVMLGIAMAISVQILPKQSMFLTRLPNYLLGPAFALALYEFRLPKLAWLGTISYEIYLCQGVFEFSLWKIGMPLWAYVVAAYVGTVLLAWLVHIASAVIEKALARGRT